jgi:two-component system CheB/CheR fusion protein
MKSMKILLVDDHNDTLRVMDRLLSLHGHRVRTAVTVRQAMEIAADAAPFDLLVSDIGLPDGTGMDLLGALRPMHPPFAAIALTGHGDEDDVAQCRRAGFEQHLLKPVSLDALLGAIDAAASHEPARAAR